MTCPCEKNKKAGATGVGVAKPKVHSNNAKSRSTLSQMLSRERSGVGLAEFKQPSDHPIVASLAAMSSRVTPAAAITGETGVVSCADAPPPPYDLEAVKYWLTKFFASQSADDFSNLVFELGKTASDCRWGNDPNVMLEILKAKECFERKNPSCYSDPGAKLIQILCTPGWTYDPANCGCDGKVDSGPVPKCKGGMCTDSSDCKPPYVCDGAVCVDPYKEPPPLPKNPWYVTQVGAPCLEQQGVKCDPSHLECVDGKCQEKGGAPQPTPECGPNKRCPSGRTCVNGECVPVSGVDICKTDADCPAGQICVNGECVAKEAVVEEKHPMTWLWWLLGIVAAGGVGTAVYLGTRDEDEGSAKENPIRTTPEPGYAYAFTGKNWSSSHSEKWDTIAIGGDDLKHAKLVGRRTVDGAHVNVWRLTNGMYVAQT